MKRRRFLPLRILPSLLTCVAIGGARAEPAVPPSPDDIEARDLAPPAAVPVPEPPPATPLAPPPDVPPAPALPPPPPVAALTPVRGRVVSRGTRLPMAGAEIMFDTRSVGETDADGRFTILLPPGRQRLQIQQPGYDTTDVLVDAQPGDRVDYVIRLTPRTSGTRYETVVVAAERQAEHTTLREEELTRTPGSAGDPLRTVESLPGVSQVVWPLAVYAIRGANPGNTGFFLDGVRMPVLYHFALGPSVIHPFFIEQVDFYPGGYPARFGRYVSGIVHATTQTPPADRAHVSADLRLFDAGGIAVTPFHDGKGTIAVAGRLSYTGLLFSQFSPDYTFGYWDYQARIEHRLGPGRLTLFGFGSGDHLGRKTTADTHIDLGFHRLDLHWRGPVAGGSLTAGVIGGADSSATLIPQVNNLPVSVSSRSLVGRLHFTHPISEFAQWEIGGDGELQSLRPRATTTFLDQQDVLRPRTVGLAGTYLSLLLAPRPWFEISVGGRYDIYAEEGVTRAQPGPRVNARVRVADDVWLKGAFGRFSQMPSMPIAAPGFENFGLKSIGLQTSTQGSLGFESPLAQLATVDVTGFIQRMDVTDLASIFNYDVQTQLLERRPGRSYGIELMLRRAVSRKLYGWVAYTLSKSERVLPDTNARAAADWDQRHILNVVASYRFGSGHERNGYQLGARFHYNSGRPYPVFDEGSVTGNRQAVNYTHLPAFYQIDLRFDKRWTFDKYLLDVYVELINSTLSRQVFDIKTRSDGSLNEGSFRIVLPSIGLHAQW